MQENDNPAVAVLPAPIVLPTKEVKDFVQDACYEAHLLMSLAHRALNAWKAHRFAGTEHDGKIVVQQIRATALGLTGFANAIALREGTE